MSAKTFRKKPVEVEAMQVAAPMSKVAEWCGGTVLKSDRGKHVGVRVHTLIYGPEIAHAGAWIVRYPDGFYTYTGHDFAATFEEVSR